MLVVYTEYDMKNINVASVSNAFSYRQREYAIKNTGYYVKM